MFLNLGFCLLKFLFVSVAHVEGQDCALRYNIDEIGMKVNFSDCAHLVAAVTRRKFSEKHSNV